MNLIDPVEDDFEVIEFLVFNLHQLTDVEEDLDTELHVHKDRDVLLANEEGDLAEEEHERNQVDNHEHSVEVLGLNEQLVGHFSKEGHSLGLVRVEPDEVRHDVCEVEIWNLPSALFCNASFINDCSKSLSKHERVRIKEEVVDFDLLLEL